MDNFTGEQILVVSVLCVWFLFPLGMLVSFIRQSQEEKKSLPTLKYMTGHTANKDARKFDANTELFVDDDEDEVEHVPAYQIPRTNRDNGRANHPLS